MGNYNQQIVNIVSHKLCVLTSLICSSSVFAHSIPINQMNSEDYGQNQLELSSSQSSLMARRFSAREIQQMMDELEQLVNRVESTLITVEAKQNSSNLSFNDAIVESGKKSRLSNFYVNSRTYKAISDAKNLLKEFPTLVQTDISEATRRWQNARRDLWLSYPITQNLAQPEVRAVWLDRGTIVKARSKKDLEPLFDRMAKAGINTVFMETVNASYPIYPSRVAPEQNPMTRGWDPLQASIELAHERGMELHAWLWAFAAANQGHNKILKQSEQYLGPVLSRNPSWVLKDKNGQVFNRTPGFKKAFLDPANPQVRRYLISLIDEIITKYDVDGVQLDYIRYPFQDNITKQEFGYTDISRNRFKQRYGIDPIDIKRSSYQWNQWNAFKAEQVTTFVDEVSQLMKRKNPELVLSTAVFPMERNQRLNTLQQDWQEWSNRQSVDLVVLMTYALDTGSFQDRVKLVYELAEKNSNFVIPGIRLLNVPEDQAFDQMQLMRTMPTVGYALFAAENLDTPLEKIFERTQGNQDKNELIPFREPFKSIDIRYQLLKQEWIFLWQNNNIEIDPIDLKQWAKDSDELAQTLKELSKSPTSNNITKAKKQLANLKLKLPIYLNKYQRNNSSQMDTWNNRLTTIENILKYGEMKQSKK